MSLRTGKASSDTMTQTPTANSEILIYSAPDGAIKIDVQLENDTVWLTQADMARLFQTTQQNISQHLQAIYEEKELMLEATYKKILLVRKEDIREVRREIEHYNLDAIISVGYRVKSRIATEFRIWATQKLKEYIVKGFALNDERFKSGSSMNYFAELQERIREIRLSERFFYQKKTFTRPVLTMTQTMRRPESFSRSFKISCFGR